MMEIQKATIDDAEELHHLQLRAFMPVADELDWHDGPNMVETFEHFKEDMPHYVTLKMTTENGRIVGSIRGNVEDESLYIGRLMVLPEFQGKGIGTQLIRTIENTLPHSRAWLNTCEQLRGNVYLYSREGYRPFRHERINDHLTRVYMEKF